MLSTLDKMSQHVQWSIFHIAHLTDPQASVEMPTAEICCCLSFSFMLDCNSCVGLREYIFRFCKQKRHGC